MNALGLKLVTNGDDPPVIMDMKQDALAAQSGVLHIGDMLLTVNGEHVRSKEAALEALRDACGEIQLLVRRGVSGARQLAPTSPPEVQETKQCRPSPSRTRHAGVLEEQRRFLRESEDASNRQDEYRYGRM